MTLDEIIIELVTIFEKYLDILKVHEIEETFRCLSGSANCTFFKLSVWNQSVLNSLNIQDCRGFSILSNGTLVFAKNHFAKRKIWQTAKNDGRCCLSDKRGDEDTLMLAQFSLQKGYENKTLTQRVVEHSTRFQTIHIFFKTWLISWKSHSNIHSTYFFLGVYVNIKRSHRVYMHAIWQDRGKMKLVLLFYSNSPHSGF